MLLEAQAVIPPAEQGTSDEPAARPDGSAAARPIVLDVRNAYEWDAGHFQGAVRPVEDAFNETPREGEDGSAALPEALKGAAPDTPVMVRPISSLVALRLGRRWLERPAM
jgi:rhodanese-related sulfurtransferase